MPDLSAVIAKIQGWDRQSEDDLKQARQCLKSCRDSGDDGGVDHFRCDIQHLLGRRDAYAKALELLKEVDGA